MHAQEEGQTLPDSSQEAAAENYDQVVQEHEMNVALEDTGNLHEVVVAARDKEAAQSTELHPEEVAAVPDHTVGDMRCQQKLVEGAAGRHLDSNLPVDDMERRTGAVHKLEADHTEAQEPGHARRIDHNRAALAEQDTLH